MSVAIPPDVRWRLSPLLMAEEHGRRHQYVKGELVDIGWKTTRHHAVIDREFRRLLTDPDVDCLIVKAPPRHGKTEYLSRWAPAWYLLANPWARVMLNSYTMSLAKFNSRWVRDTVHRLAPLWNLKGVDSMARRADDWSIEDVDGGGGMLASGVDGSQTGRGAQLILIDDYLRSAKDAVSETVRDAQWEWFKGTISTRREPGGKICILATQWHSDDLIGRILANREEIGIRVRCITLQALREENGTPDPLRRQPGEALWPERWPAAVLGKQKLLMGPYWWSAQYQGNPGTMGMAEWPAHYFANVYLGEGEWPERGFHCSALYCDPAKGKHKRKGDYYAIVFAGFAGGRLYIKSDIDRAPIGVIARRMAEMTKALRPTFTGVEANAFQFLMAPHYQQACEDVGIPIDPPALIDNTLPKALRISALDPWLANRLLRFERSTSNELLVKQAQVYPFGKHDDGPDGLAGAVRLLCSSVDELAGLENPADLRPGE